MKLFLSQEKLSNLMKDISNKRQNPGNFADTQGKWLQRKQEKTVASPESFPSIILKRKYCNAYLPNAGDEKTADNKVPCLLQYEALKSSSGNLYF